MFEIKKTIQINAPITRVFRALTDSDEIPKYYPLNKVESTWTLGADVIYKGEVNGQAFSDFGTIEQLESPTLYSYRYWSDNHGTERTPDNHLMISYQLRAHAAGTELTMRQTNIKSQDMYQLMDTQVWDFLLASLKQYLESSTT